MRNLIENKIYDSKEIIMKKIMTVLLALVMVFSLVACSNSKTEDKTEAKTEVQENAAVFEVGKDAVEVEAAGASEYDPTYTVNLRVVGGNGEDLYNGTVTLKSPTMWVNEFLKAAVTDKGLAQSGIETGFIETIGDYVNNSSDGLFWMYRINGEWPPFGSNQMQARNGDYIEFAYEKPEME